MNNQVWRVKLFKFRGRNSYLGEENVNTQKQINIYGEREREKEMIMQFLLPILDRQRRSFRCRCAEIGSDAVFVAEAEIDSGAVFAADFSMNSDAELGGRCKTGFR